MSDPITPNVTPQELNQWLEKEGKKDAWLANKIGVTNVAIGRWKRGEREIPQYIDKMLRQVLRNENPFSDDPRTRIDLSEEEFNEMKARSIREGYDSVYDWMAGKVRLHLKMVGEIEGTYHKNSPEKKANQEPQK